jgi:hypothetical protein
MNLKSIFCSSILIISLVAPSAWANSVSYKWLDDGGNIVYSQTPPRDREYETIRTKSSSGISSTSSSGNSSSAVKALEESATARKEKEAEAKKDADTQQKRAIECEKAKKNVETFTIYRRVRKPDGSVVRLDDNERTKLLEEAKQNVADLCD